MHYQSQNISSINSSFNKKYYQNHSLRTADGCQQAKHHRWKILRLYDAHMTYGALFFKNSYYDDINGLKLMFKQFEK